MIVLDPRDYRARLLRRFFAGCLVGTAAALAVASSAEPVVYHVAPTVTDPRMETACKPPQIEGAMTVYAVLDGKLVCWRWQ